MFWFGLFILFFTKFQPSTIYVRNWSKSLLWWWVLKATLVLIFGLNQKTRILAEQFLYFSGLPGDIQELDQYVKVFPHSKDYQCELCGFVSNRPAKVKNHLEAIHFPGVFVYSCDLCDKTFNGRNAFGVHKTIVHSKKKFH